MLSFKNVNVRRGGELVLAEITFTIFAGQKVGLVGANGAGKSSLFAAILGSLPLDLGSIQWPQNIVLAHVAQETPSDPRAALEYVLDGDAELRRLEHELAQATEQGAAHLGECHERFAAIDGYSAPARAARLLAGLGFAPGTEQHPVASFSGGWRMRLNLARALMCRSDLLLLDEPTNHLDLDAVIWLEQWLLNYPGTLVLISHDRDFLDRVVGHIAHLEEGRFKLYTGNYSAFERARAAQLAGQQAAYQKQQREVTHMQAFIFRFRAKATKARQAQSRMKALEKLELIAPAHVDSPFTFEFKEPAKLPRPLLTMTDASVGYGERVVLQGLKFTLQPGDRLALLGANGAGKSTFIKLLAGELAPRAGEVTCAKDLAIGYFAQHQLEQLRADDTALAHLLRLDPRAREQDLRNFLGGFNFPGTMLERPVRSFSGGEKARLVLALLMYSRPNLLLLDEPTNHLDLEMRHALTVALQDFAGALVVVAHDRHLLRTTTDTFWMVANGAVQPWTGDLDDYAAWLRDYARQERVPPANASAIEPRINERARRQAAAQARERLTPLKRAVRSAESELERLQRARVNIAAKLEDAELYTSSSHAALSALLQEKREIEAAVAIAEKRWLEASEQLEEAREAASPSN